MKKKILIICVSAFIGFSAIITYIISNKSMNSTKNLSVSKKTVDTKKVSSQNLQNFQNAVVKSYSALGNTPSNLEQNAPVACSSNYMFGNYSLINHISSQPIFRCYDDGITAFTKIVKPQPKGTLLFLNLHKDWLYYLNSVKGIYRSKTNGEKAQIFLKGNYKSFIICKNDIFYLGVDGYLYKTSINNPLRKIYLDNRVSYFTISNDGTKLLYTKIAYSKIYLYKAKTSKPSSTKSKYFSIITEALPPYVYEKGYVYFFPDTLLESRLKYFKNEKTVYRLNTSGTNRKIENYFSSKNDLFNFIIYKSHLYFSDQTGVSDMDIATSHIRKLPVPYSYYILTIGNKLLFLSAGDDENTQNLYIYNIKTGKVVINTLDNGNVQYFPIE